MKESNSSVNSIEADLMAIEEQELAVFYNNNTSATSASEKLPPSLSMKGFVQHATFHLWLLLPLILLFMPTEPKFVDKWVLRFLSRKKPKNILKYQWKHDKLRIPLIITFILFFSALWGLLWGLLHLQSQGVR